MQKHLIALLILALILAACNSVGTSDPKGTWDSSKFDQATWQ